MLSECMMTPCSEKKGLTRVVYSVFIYQLSPSALPTYPKRTKPKHTAQLPVVEAVCESEESRCAPSSAAGEARPEVLILNSKVIAQSLDYLLSCAFLFTHFQCVAETTANGLGFVQMCLSARRMSVSQNGHAAGSKRLSIMPKPSETQSKKVKASNANINSSLQDLCDGPLCHPCYDFFFFF